MAATSSKPQRRRLGDLGEAERSLSSALQGVRRGEDLAERGATRVIRFVGGIAEKALSRARQNVRREIRREQARSRRRVA